MLKWLSVLKGFRVWGGLTGWSGKLDSAKTAKTLSYLGHLSAYDSGGIHSSQGQIFKGLVACSVQLSARVLKGLGDLRGWVFWESRIYSTFTTWGPLEWLCAAFSGPFGWLGMVELGSWVSGSFRVFAREQPDLEVVGHRM